MIYIIYILLSSFHFSTPQAFISEDSHLHVNHFGVIYDPSLSL